MSLKQVPLAEASTEQIKEFAETTLGIEIHANSKPETARAKIADAWDKDFILVGESEPRDDVPEPGQGPLPVSKGQMAPKPGYVRVYIPQSDSPGGRDHVELSVNGRAMLVARDKNQDIKYPYFEALRNAVKAIYDPLPEGGISTTPRMVPHYNFQLIALGEPVTEDDELILKAAREQAADAQQAEQAQAA